MAGHEKKAFNVTWSPFHPALLLSSSDDRTARIWDYTKGSCLMVLKGHTSNVRAVHWSQAIPHICITGSWDSSIRVWDIRDGSCLKMVKDHCGDVYGFDASPMRPFTFASSSRDTTLRIWTMEDSVADLQFALLSGLPAEHFIANDPNVPQPIGTRPRLAGKAIHELMNAIGPERNRIQKLSLVARYFCAPSGVRDLLQIAEGMITGVPLEPSTASEVYRVEDAEQMLELHISEQMRKKAAGRKKEEKMKEIAKLQLQMGRIEEACESMIAIDEWEKALAIAPAASLDLWRKLSARYAAKLKAENSTDSATHMLAIGDVKGSVGYYLDQGMHKDAFQLASMHTHHKTPAKRSYTADGEGEENEEERKGLLYDVAHTMGNNFQVGGEPIKVACTQLSTGNRDAAVQTLMVNGEYFLAQLICLMFEMPPPNAFYEVTLEHSTPSFHPNLPLNPKSNPHRSHPRRPLKSAPPSTPMRLRCRSQIR